MLVVEGGAGEKKDRHASAMAAPLKTPSNAPRYKRKEKHSKTE
jgi:hypothetical protein